jgi:hypothetical protein
MKGEVKNHIPIWRLGLEYQTIASCPDEPVQSFVEKSNDMTLKIVFDRAEPFLQIIIWVPMQTT